MDAFSKERIKEHMPVVGMDDAQVGLVDDADDPTAIKLTKDEQGQHHWIPMTWVRGIDDKVHLDRPAQEARQDWLSSPPQPQGREALGTQQ